MLQVSHLWGCGECNSMFTAYHLFDIWIIGEWVRKRGSTGSFYFLEICPSCQIFMLSKTNHRKLHLRRFCVICVFCKAVVVYCCGRQCRWQSDRKQLCSIIHLLSYTKPAPNLEVEGEIVPGLPLFSAFTTTPNLHQNLMIACRWKGDIT